MKGFESVRNHPRDFADYEPPRDQNVLELMIPTSLHARQREIISSHLLIACESFVHVDRIAQCVYHDKQMCRGIEKRSSTARVKSVVLAATVPLPACTTTSI